MACAGVETTSYAQSTAEYPLSPRSVPRALQACAAGDRDCQFAVRLPCHVIHNPTSREFSE